MAAPTTIEELGRLRQVADVILRHEGDFLLDQLRLGHLLPKGKKPKGKEKRFYQAVRIRKILEELGGTFVKLGQLLSLRPDIFPKDFIEELSRLQDEVRPVPFQAIRAVVESDLKKPLREAFASFERKPLSSASVSQVHRAKLHDGTAVAVKVQRPEMEKLFAEDIAILKYLAGQAEKHLSITLFSPVEFVKEFEEYTEKELDFQREAKNIDRFYQYFAKDKHLAIPKVYWGLTTKRVLTMEFIEGIPIHRHEELSAAGLDPRAIATALSNAIYTQMFIWGVFHGDPHPGNVLALKGNRIALLDFGIVGRFTPVMQRHLRQVFIAMLEGDIDSITEGLLLLKVLTQESDPEQFKRDMLEHLAQFYDLSLEHVKLSDFVLEMLSVMRKNRLQVPHDFVLLGKALLTLEGTCHVLDPGFNPVETGRSFLQVIIRHERNPKYLLQGLMRETTRFATFLQNLPEQTREAIDVLRKSDDYILSINNSLKVLTLEMDRTSSRLVKAMLMSVLILAGAYMVRLDISPVRGVSLPSVVCFALAALIGVQLVIATMREQRFVRRIFSESFFRKLFRKE